MKKRKKKMPMKMMMKRKKKNKQKTNKQKTNKQKTNKQKIKNKKVDKTTPKTIFFYDSFLVFLLISHLGGFRVDCTVLKYNFINTNFYHLFVHY